MAIKGQEEKNILIKTIKEAFPDSFECDKVLRVPIGDVQIKVSLVCAKDNVAVDRIRDTSAQSESPAPSPAELVMVNKAISKLMANSRIVNENNSY